MITIKDKDDAISHINNLFPIGQDPEWDRVWLETILSMVMLLCLI